MTAESNPESKIARDHVNASDVNLILSRASPRRRQVYSPPVLEDRDEPTMSFSSVATSEPGGASDGASASLSRRKLPTTRSSSVTRFSRRHLSANRPSHRGSVEGLPSMVVLRQERCVFRQPAAERALVDPAPLRGALDRLLRQQRQDRRLTDGRRFRAVTRGSGPFFAGICGRLRVVFADRLAGPLPVMRPLRREQSVLTVAGPRFEPVCC